MLFLLLRNVGPLPGGERVDGPVVGRGGLWPDQALLPGGIKCLVHLVLAVEALEGLRFVGSVGLRIILRDLGRGSAIGSHHFLLARRVRTRTVRAYLVRSMYA